MRRAAGGSISVGPSPRRSPRARRLMALEREPALARAAPPRRGRAAARSAPLHVRRRSTSRGRRSALVGAARDQLIRRAARRRPTSSACSLRSRSPLAGVQPPRAIDLALLAADGARRCPLWVLLFKLYGLYDRDIKRISHSSVDDLPVALPRAARRHRCCFWAYYEAAPGAAADLPRERAVRRSRRSSRSSSCAGRCAPRAGRCMGPERVLFVGTGPQLQPLLRKIGQHPEYGLEPIGAARRPNDDRRVPTAITVRPLPCSAAPSELERCSPSSDARPGAHLPLRSSPPSRCSSMIDTCRRFSVKVSILPDAVESLGPSVEVDEVEGVTCSASTRRSRAAPRGDQARLRSRRRGHRCCCSLAR